MNWPSSQDYNEAIQSAASATSDPDLKNGEPTVNSIGLPVPRSGNFADVYQFKGADGTMWAVKCFTRQVPGLDERYTKINAYLEKAGLPFTVGFKYLTEGIRIRGQWYPLLKMQWIEGFTLNEFVRQNSDKPTYLHGLMQMWAKLTGRLRDANIAHADLQHGNVLLVPGNTPSKLGLKLIDYDGMWVPPLADYHSGEVGHPNFQHPARLKERLFNADVDRYPHLVIACALRATLVGGKALWDRFDNGDNLLFREQDLREPEKAPIFKALWDLNDDVVRTLVGHIAMSTKEPLRKTPWLDDILFEDEGPHLSPARQSQVVAMLGVTPPAAKVAEAPAQREFGDFELVDDDDPDNRPRPERKRRVGEAEDSNDKGYGVADDAVTPRRRPKKTKARAEKKSKLPLFIGAGVAAVALFGVVLALGFSGKKQQEVKPEPEVAQKGPEPKPKDPGNRNEPDVDPGKKRPTPADPKPVEPGPTGPGPVGLGPVPKGIGIQGGNFDPEFKDVAPDRGLLVGLEVGLGRWGNNDVVKSARPIFRMGQNESLGKQWGPDVAGAVKVIARPGYAVGAMIVKSASLVDGLSLTFMKIADGRLDPNDAYESEWIGGRGGFRLVKLGGDGELVTGIRGKTNPRQMSGIGLLEGPQKADDPVIQSTGVRGGRPKDPEFRDAAEEDGLLVGLEVGIGKWGKTNDDVVHALRPIFRSAAADAPGKQWGRSTGVPVKLIAKPGYAIGEITIKSNVGLGGLSIRFMKVVNGALNPQDSYESDWVGGKGAGPRFRLAGNGVPVVGIVGRTDSGGHVSGFGLLQKQASGGK